MERCLTSVMRLVPLFRPVILIIFQVWLSVARGNSLVKGDWWRKRVHRESASQSRGSALQKRRRKWYALESSLFSYPSGVIDEGELRWSDSSEACPESEKGFERNNTFCNYRCDGKREYAYLLVQFLAIHCQVIVWTYWYCFLWLVPLEQRPWDRLRDLLDAVKNRNAPQAAKALYEEADINARFEVRIVCCWWWFRFMLSLVPWDAGTDTRRYWITYYCIEYEQKIVHLLHHPVLYRRAKRRHWSQQCRKATTTLSPKEKRLLLALTTGRNIRKWPRCFWTAAQTLSSSTKYVWMDKSSSLSQEACSFCIL